MKAIPYISFNGNCEEAVGFYQSVLGGKIEIIRFKDLPEEAGIPVSDNWKERVMHCSLTFEDGNVLYFGDTWEDSPVQIGNNCTIHLTVENEKDVYDIVERLSEDGEITMPADKTFWNSVYGSLIDTYGISWGIEFEFK